MRQEEATLETDRYNLSKVRIESPINGIVTRRNIEEGEMVVVGTMNNAGTVLLTIADMSVIEAEVEVDETDIPSVSLGQVAKITIDAIPEKTFTGKVTEIGISPIQVTGQARQATNFKVVVTLDNEIPEVRPDSRARRRSRRRPGKTSCRCPSRRQRFAKWSSTTRARSSATSRPRTVAGGQAADPCRRLS